MKIDKLFSLDSQHCVRLIINTVMISETILCAEMCFCPLLTSKAAPVIYSRCYNSKIQYSNINVAFYPLFIALKMDNRENIERRKNSGNRP